MSLAAPYLNRDAVFVPPDPHTMPEAELIEKLSDPHWRLRNLYWVVNKDGKAQLFTPWPKQEKFYDNIWYRNVIPKARQRGFSTAVQLMMLDGAIFVPATSAAVIAQDDAIAIQIMQKKMKFAYDRLPDFIRNEVARVRYNNKHEFAWNNDSSMLVASSTRGNTLQWLHVSEYGQICAKSPDHAEEIQEGSLASVDQHGTIVVESTVETPFGHFSEMVKTAQAVQQSGRPLTPMDYRLHFASWWDADEYETDPTHIVISPKDKAYFHRGRDRSRHQLAQTRLVCGEARHRIWRRLGEDVAAVSVHAGRGVHRLGRWPLALRGAGAGAGAESHRQGAVPPGHPGQHVLGSARQQGGLVPAGRRRQRPLDQLLPVQRRALFLRRAPHAGAAVVARLCVGPARPAA